jgi:peptide methionine sulfoxide reductase msrA/msrB
MAEETGKTADAPQETATFAGGCFWCMEPAYRNHEGVFSAVVGYTGGAMPNPTYEKVSMGKTGHAEAIQIVFDPTRVSYTQLLDIFWKQIDPTDPGGQFADRGSQYRTYIYYHTEAQRRAAEASKARLEQSGKFNQSIATRIVAAMLFYPAEEYHQNYDLKKPLPYKIYKIGSGREAYLEKTWRNSTMEPKSQQVYQKPDPEELEKRLTALQFRVTQENGTERPFKNEYWNNKHEGIYVDIVSGEPLFSSRDKYESESGWPSFTQPLEPGNIKESEDRNLAEPRTEIRSTHGDSHLGHVFHDGPPPQGLRYCTNSAALRFIPKEDLNQEGYAKYDYLFQGH